MRLKYNAPVILTYTLLCTIVLLVSEYAVDLRPLFTIFPEFRPGDPTWYFQLFSHVIGHANWEHLTGNFTMILLIGPILEEKYGSRDLLLMMAVTALVTGLLHIFFFSEGLMGASGVVFMLILLSSFTNNRGGIPLTFVLVVVLFLGKEIVAAFGEDNVSQFAHIIGGALGGVFGFIWEKRPAQQQTPGRPLG